MRFPEFTEEWKKCTIKDYGEVITGNTPPTKNTEYYSNGSYLWASPADLGLSKHITATKTKLSLLGLKKTRTIPQGSILVTCIGSTIGKMGMATETMSTNQQINSVIVNDSTNNDFAYYAILNAFPRYLSEVGVQAVPILSKSNFEKLPNHTTTKEEQRKLGYFLNLLDERIATQNKIIEKLQSLIKGIVDELMTVLLKGKLYPFSSFYIKAGEGGTPTTSVNEYYLGGTIPFIKIEDLSCKYLTSNKDFITELGMQKSSAWLIPSHSVIYSNGATIGAISINEYPICTKQGILGIVPNTNINVEYLYLLMSSSYFSKEVNRIVTEGTMKTAYLKDINHIKCPLPSMAQQQNITNLTSSIEKKLFVEQELLKLLNIQKQHLLRTMFI